MLYSHLQFALQVAFLRLNPFNRQKSAWPWLGAQGLCLALLRQRFQ
jgi:hypothetical protein